MKTGIFYRLFFQQIIVILQSVVKGYYFWKILFKQMLPAFVVRETGVSALASRKQKHKVVMCCHSAILTEFA